MEDKTTKTLSITSQGAWLMFAKIVGFVLSALLPLLVVRYLAQDKVGVYRQSFQVISTAVSILPLGFGMSAFYFLNREAELRKAAILNIVLFNFMAGGLAWAALYLYPEVLGKIFQSQEMIELAPKIGLVIWLWIFSAFLEVVAIADRKVQTATVFIILSQLTKTALMSCAVIMFATVEAFLYAAIVQASLQIIILLAYLNKSFLRFWTTFNRHFFFKQLFYVLPYGFAGLLWTVQSDIHYYFVGYRFSEAEFAIYAYGCFQLPLISMLSESTTAVMLPRMSELQIRGNLGEMVRLTARAMQKLAFFYFPTYVFLLITAFDFITTLFTKNYTASVPVFIIYLTLLPLNIVVTDPVLRAYKEFGKVVLLLRGITTIILVMALYFGLQHFDLLGMITIVVVLTVVQGLGINFVLARWLNVKSRDWRLLGGVGRTAIAAAASGVFLLVFYLVARDVLLEFSIYTSRNFLSIIKFQNAADFLGGVLFLGFCFVIYAPIYLFFANRLGVIESEDKKKLIVAFRRLTFREVAREEVL